MRKIILGLLPLVFAVSCNSGAKQESKFSFDGSISREVLENYLSRSISMAEFLTVDPYCVDCTYPDKEADIQLIKETGAKFISRSIYRWGRIEALAHPDYWSSAKELARKVHEFDPEVIFQAGVFEAVYPEVELISVPAWAFEALGLPVEDRKFRYADMLNQDGIHATIWGTGGAPDITRIESQLWFMYLIGSYVDVGAEAIHFGQIAIVGMNDHNWESWESFLTKARKYVNPRARRNYVLFDAHTPDGGMVRNGISLLDFNAFPMRIKAVADKPMQGCLEVGYLDAMYGRSLGCKTPSGWECEALPYLLEFDNYGVSDHPGEARAEHFIWGYDEISWFYLQQPEYRKEFLKYANKWIRDTDPNAYLSMPGARLVVRGEGLPDIACRAIAPTENCPYGMDLEGTIKEIWSQDKQ